MLASLVPQGAASEPEVAAWAAARPIVGAVALALGLHDAFAAPLFVVCVVALAVSTALCAWQRTRIAFNKGRILSSAGLVDRPALLAEHDVEIACEPTLTESEMLSIASETLGRLGVRTRRRDGLIAAVSPVWSLWGSPVFHWALLAIIVTLVLGNLFRSSGQMGLAVGQEKADAPGSYGIISAGPLRGWMGVQRTIRVDAFDPTYATGGVNRGPTPTVSVLDARGRVIKSQRVYPNMTLKTGSLTIYPADYGLAASVSYADENGAEGGRSVQLIDFSAQAEGGTVPAGALTIRDDVGGTALKLLISVPLDKAEGGLAARLPRQLKARVVATSPEGQPLLDRVLTPGEELGLPGGATLRLLDVGYYARLQLVDDPSIPVLYAMLTVAMIGLGVAALARQQIVMATIMDARRTDPPVAQCHQQPQRDRERACPCVGRN
jgi:cytochrome c biogenesis protein ResB